MDVVLLGPWLARLLDRALERHQVQLRAAILVFVPFLWLSLLIARFPCTSKVTPRRTRPAP
jgi:hypothetical protein